MVLVFSIQQDSCLEPCIIVNYLISKVAPHPGNYTVTFLSQQHGLSFNGHIEAEVPTCLILIFNFIHSP